MAQKSMTGIEWYKRGEIGSMQRPSETREGIELQQHSIVIIKQPYNNSIYRERAFN